MLKEKTEQSDSNITFLSIIAGELRQTVPEGTPGAILREWVISGVPGKKWEVPFPGVEGIISSVEFHESERFGKNISVWLKDGGELFCVSVGVKSPYGEDIIKKLPSVNLKESVTLTPYEFTPKGKDKELKGVTFTQNGVKLKNFYKDAEGNPLNGLPTTDGNTEGMDKEERSEFWTSFFSKQRRFMIKEIETKIIPKLEPAPEFRKKEEKVEEVGYGNKLDNFEKKEDGIKFPVEDIDPNDIPF